MSLIDRAKTDWQRFTTNSDEFGVSILLQNPAETVSLSIVGLATKHRIGIDTDGNLVNTKNAHCSFAEKPLTDASYPVRNSSGEVFLEGHRVSWKDSTGNTKKYVIREWYQDETVGMIVCILGDFV